MTPISSGVLDQAVRGASESVEQIRHNGEMLALIVRDEYSKPGISFFTPNDLSQQLAYMHHPAGKVIDAHFHNPVPRTVAYTQETLFIKRGRLRVDFFDDEQQLSRKPGAEGRRCHLAHQRWARL